MTEKPYITCRELIEFLLDYLTGELAKERSVEFERHLAVCPSCVAYIRNYEETIRLGRMAFISPDAPAGESEEVPEDLVKAILAARGK